jgi:hypothetical protein
MGHHWGRGDPIPLILLFTSLFSAAFARERFLYALLFAWLQVKGVTLYLLDNVFLLHLAFKAAQRILEGLALLEPDFCQPDNTPRLAQYGPE